MPWIMAVIEPGGVPSAGNEKARCHRREGTAMYAGQHLALVDMTTPQGWVGPAAIVAGVLLLIVALFRRSRATLAKKRRATHPGGADWW